MKKKKFHLFILFCLILAIFIAVIFLLLGQQRRSLRVTFFDVGQGDASLIQAPNGQNILIDGGPSDEVLLGLSRVLPFWDRGIDLMILTHPHDDHVSGLISVLKRYKIDKALYTDVAGGDSSYQYWLNLAQRKKINLLNVADFDYINLSNDCGLRIFYPKEDLSGQAWSNINNTSLVVQLDCLGHKVLFMGDAEVEVENYLLESDYNLNSQAIKIAHHGSDTSSSVDFLELVSPEIAIISVGENNYFNHPSQQIINRLERFNAKVYRTDENGNISISWSDNKILVNNFVN